jgi:hypothetical protein
MSLKTKIFIPLQAMVFLFFGNTGISQNTVRVQDSKQRIADILAKSREYCRKLERAAFNYVCTEKITEEMVQSFLDTRTTVDPRTGQTTQEYFPSERRLKNTYVYDYQMIRKKDSVKESRILMEENGKACCIHNAQLKTMFVKFANGVFGPVGLLSESEQKHYNYTFPEEKQADDGNLIVARVQPKDSQNPDKPFGKIWIKKDGFAVLKIEWSQESLGNFPAIIEFAKKLKATPRITAITEFAYEKNGIRFPSRLSVEEAYIKKRDKKEIRSLTVVEYVNYKFFTVETEIDYH